MIKIYTDSGRKKTKDEIKAACYQEFMYKCKCNHTQLIPYNVNKVICSHCGKYIYKDKKIEFKERITQLLKKRGNYE